MEKSNKPMYGLTLPRKWDLMRTILLPENVTNFVEKYQQGKFWAWPVKSPVWFKRVCELKKGECDFFLSYKDTRMVELVLTPEKVHIEQAKMKYDGTLKIRKSEKEWVEENNIERIAEAFGMPNVAVYLEYMRKYFTAMDFYILYVDSDRDKLLGE